MYTIGFYLLMIIYLHVDQTVDVWLKLKLQQFRTEISANF